MTNRQFIRLENASPEAVYNGEQKGLGSAEVRQMILGLLREYEHDATLPSRDRKDLLEAIDLLERSRDPSWMLHKTTVNYVIVGLHAIPR